MNPDLEAKLRELIDRQEIHDLLLRYARGLDRMDRELVRSCYWDDAIDDHHSFVGSPDAFVDWALAMHEGSSVQHHCMSNHTCELDGDDAHAETYYTYVGGNLSAPHLLSIGRYIDHFQRRDGVWKMANRVTVIEKNFRIEAYPGDELILAGDTQHGPLVPATRDRNDVSYQRPVRPRSPRADA